MPLAFVTLLRLVIQHMSFCSEDINMPPFKKVFWGRASLTSIALKKLTCPLFEEPRDAVCRCTCRSEEAMVCPTPHTLLGHWELLTLLCRKG